MNMKHIQDISFLKELNKIKIKVHYAKIILLDFNEKPIKEIQGVIQSGTLNINGSAAVRRTINLSILANANNSAIENVENEISLNKKVKILIGYQNPLRQYAHYGDVVWFPCGTFILSSANISRSISNWSISISGKDKMALLDGTAGGTLSASTTFHEAYVEDEDENITIYYPTIAQIIIEAVHHLGGELLDNIIISDLEETAKLLIKYIGDSPIYFNEAYSSFSWVYNEKEKYTNPVYYGQDVGYKQTEFTYPGELILKAGETVVSLLDKICKTLGNFEFFYDVNGKFIFQEKKNYLNNQTSIVDLQVNDYVSFYSDTKYKYLLTDLEDVSSITKSPKYENIKNDFVVWGIRETPSGSKIDIRYHLAIDVKPDIYYANQYMYEVYDDFDKKSLLRYEFSDSEKILSEETKYKLIGKPCQEWREELYRLALIYSLNGDTYSAYDAELLMEWRRIYDPLNSNWEDYNYWNPIVFKDPGQLQYWLELIDEAEISKYSVNMIGRRTKVVSETEIKTIYNMGVPDIVFLNFNETDLSEDEKSALLKNFSELGQKYFIWNDQTMYNMFVTSSTGASAFDKIRELLYIHLSYNTQINLQCSPRYYLEPNNIIRIEDKESGVIGDYVISQISLPLTHNGMMNITAIENLVRF